MKNHKHDYFHNEDHQAECLTCGLLESTIEAPIKVTNKTYVCDLNGDKISEGVKSQLTDTELLIKTAKELTIAKVEKLIIEEILIAHKENTPTSRLTSLLNKIKQL